MSTIGELVQETIDYSSRNLPARALIPACIAYNETAKRAFVSDELSQLANKKFMNENWWLINFMGLRQPSQLPESIFQEAQKIIPGFNRSQTFEDIILFIIRVNLISGSMPPGFNFNDSNRLEADDGEILLPPTLSNALVGVAIFHPVNRNESISENYWINFGNFRTFVSELWGREDLAKRAIRLS